MERRIMFGDMLKCPFCGNEKVKVISCDEDCCDDTECEGCIKKCYAVRCPKTEGGCGATSGWNKTKEEAKNAWNCREGQSDEI